MDFQFICVYIIPIMSSLIPMTIKDRVIDTIVDNYDVEYLESTDKKRLEYLEELKHKLFNENLCINTRAFEHISDEMFLTIIKETYYYYETKFSIGKNVIDALDDKKKLFNLYALMVFDDVLEEVVKIIDDVAIPLYNLNKIAELGDEIEEKDEEKEEEEEEEEEKEDEDEDTRCGYTGGIIYGLRGCGQWFYFEDTCMYENTSFCVECYENLEENGFEAVPEKGDSDFETDSEEDDEDEDDKK